MGNSSNYHILRYGHLSYAEDYEYRYRFYRKHYDTETVKPHFLSFRVWAESINLRYFIEMVMYFALLITFQYYVVAYNKDLHILTSEIEETKVLDGKILETSLLIEEAPTEALTEEYQTLMEEKAALTAD